MEIMESIEFMDIVDENDLVIGSCNKNEVYTKSLCHRICHIIIFNDNGDIALQLRSKYVSYAPNHRSTSVGGHVQSGETYEEAALREYKEELGMQTKVDFMGKGFYNVSGVPSKFLGIFKTVYNGTFKPDPKVVENIKFFSIQEIKDMIRKGDKFEAELLFILERYVF